MRAINGCERWRKLVWERVRVGREDAVSLTRVTSRKTYRPHSRFFNNLGQSDSTSALAHGLMCAAVALTLSSWILELMDRFVSHDIPPLPQATYPAPSRNRQHNSKWVHHNYFHSSRLRNARYSACHQKLHRDSVDENNVEKWNCGD